MEVYSNNGANNYQLNTSGIQPGVYYVYMKKGDEYSNYSPGPIRINNSPILRITDPDNVGDIDWSAKYSSGWDMNRSSDISYRRNITSMSVRNSVLSARNTNNDPYMHMQLLRRRINSGTFRFLSFRYKYTGSFSLVRGTMARFIWSTNGRNRYIGDDIVTYDGGWHTYTIDMKKYKTEAGRYAWRGYVPLLRFDANEDRYGSRRFYLDYVKLCSEDRLSSRFRIWYRNIDRDTSRNTLRLFYDTDKRPGNGNERLIVSRRVGTGTSSYWWRASSSIRKRVWIYGEVSDGINSNVYYSTGSLRVHI